ncbi:MAG: hypothetical protein WCY11_02490 [Novosphingobium sp.]
MIIYGGYSALLRGAPFPHEGSSDIDLFGSIDELGTLLAALASSLPGPLSLMTVPAVPWRHVIMHPSRDAPPDWRTIEFEVVQPDFHALIHSLPDNSPTTLFGIPYLHTGADTDYLIKQAVVDILPEPNPKHAADLAAAGFVADQCSAAHLAFYVMFRSHLLVERDARYPALATA